MHSTRTRKKRRKGTTFFWNTQEKTKINTNLKSTLDKKDKALITAPYPLNENTLIAMPQHNYA